MPANVHLTKSQAMLLQRMKNENLLIRNFLSRVVSLVGTDDKTIKNIRYETFYALYRSHLLIRCPEREQSGNDYYRAKRTEEE
jgi:hypothetical protein